MATLGDDATRTAPTWDTFDPSQISGDEYKVADSGFPVWRGIRAPAAGGTLVFRTASLWTAKIPGGSYDENAKTLTRVFTAYEPLGNVQIIAIVKAGSTAGIWEVVP